MCSSDLIPGINFELPSRRRVDDSSQDRVDHPAVARNDDGLAEMCAHGGIEGAIHTIVELRDRLPTRKDDGVWVPTPVRSPIATHVLIETETVTLRTWIVFTEVRIDDHVGEAERAFHDLCSLHCPRIGTRNQDVGCDLLRQRQSISQGCGLQGAELRQAGARSRTTDHTAHGDDRLAVPNEDDPGLGHANFSTKLSNWRRLRHSYTPSVNEPYSPTTESPVFQ